MSKPDVAGASSVAAARRVVTAQFASAGIDSPALDARLLVGYALGLDHTALATSAARSLTSQEQDAIGALAARRLSGEPVARILGVKEFWGLPFALSPATLVPRPDTETVVIAALTAIGENRKREPLRIADLGTGTGALLLALLHEFPHATGLGSDIDPQAIETAHANARALGLETRARFVLAGFDTALNETFDLVVSNPPYIPTRDIDGLAREVREHDPRLALDGGADGLDAYRAIARQAPALLGVDGRLVVEIGVGQEADVAAILAAAGDLEGAAAHRDLGGILRALTFRRAGRGRAVSG
ncbi:MAG: peptide chain release factor N(5)-glutamine methyltransferase [Pseudorhodoplanes sp.]|uniref:peptide chain release factor N(5)-glutamine methyltransferase n=1 Tax=Pseudorhodoplanes sp. TaxID=1934341 RepID=UPI003D0A19A6